MFGRVEILRKAECEFETILFLVMLLAKQNRGGAETFTDLRPLESSAQRSFIKVSGWEGSKVQTAVFH